MSSMERPVAPAPTAAPDRLRWLDLLPPLVFTVLGIILIVAVLVGLSRASHAFFRANLQTITLVGALAVYLAFGSGIAVALRRLRKPVVFLRLRWPTLGDLGLTLLLLVPWYLGLIMVSLLSALAFNGGRIIPGNSRLVFTQHPNGIGLLLVALLVTAVAAPVCEEIFFRGMLFRLLESRTALWLAVLGSALAFGAAHASPSVSLALLPTFVYMGVVLALLYVRTGWLTNTILLHSLNNAVVTIVAFNAATR